MLYDVWTVFWRDWVVLKHRMIKFILSRMVAPMLYLVAFGWGLGRSMPPIGGGSYIDFLVPGILALNSMNISFNSITPLHSERIYHKSLEEYLVAPIRPLAFIIGKIWAAVLRGLISSVIIVVLAYLFGANFMITPLFVLVLIFNCIIFAEIGFGAAMTIHSYEDMGRFNTYILLPMSFLCGTFFATDKLPLAAKYFVELLPLTHTSYLLRNIGAGHDFSLLSAFVLALYMCLGLIICIWAMRKIKE
jgi:ABC-type polysaccharide/polyol phosphate export permease